LSRGHLEGLTEPFQLKAAIWPAFAAEAELALEHLQGQPQLRCGGSIALKPLPTGLLGQAVDHQSAAFLLSGLLSCRRSRRRRLSRLTSGRQPD